MSFVIVPCFLVNFTFALSSDSLSSNQWRFIALVLLKVLSLKPRRKVAFSESKERSGFPTDNELKSVLQSLGFTLDHLHLVIQTMDVL